MRSRAWRGGRDGAIAQLGERLLCKQEVVGSIPSGSTRPAARMARENVQKKSNSSAAYRSGLLDIVKKGYARGAEQLYQFCSGRPQASCREGLAQARHEALMLFGSELA